MAQTLIPLTQEVILKNSESGKTAGFGGKLGFRIDRTGGLIVELGVDILVSAAFAVAPTGVDVRQFIEQINLKSSDGELVAALSGQEIYDFARLTEKQPVPKLTPGAGGGAVGTVRYYQEIHLEMDGTYFGQMTGLVGEEASKLDLEIIVANATKAQHAFTGATFAAAPLFAFTADVEVYSHPDFQSIRRSTPSVGTQCQYLVNKTLAQTSTGRHSLELDPSCLMRAIVLHVDDVSAGAGLEVPSDSIVSNVRLVQGNKLLRETTFTDMRFVAESKTELGNVVGCGVLWWGDQETAFASLDTSPVQLQFDIVGGAPAWRVQATQNYKRDRKTA